MIKPLLFIVEGGQRPFCEVYRTDMNGELNIEVKKDGRIMEKNLEVTKKASNLKSLLY